MARGGHGHPRGGCGSFKGGGGGVHIRSLTNCMYTGKAWHHGNIITIIENPEGGARPTYQTWW